MSPLVVVLALTDLPPWALYAGSRAPSASVSSESSPWRSRDRGR